MQRLNRFFPTIKVPGKKNAAPGFLRPVVREADPDIAQGPHGGGGGREGPIGLGGAVEADEECRVVFFPIRRMRGQPAVLLEMGGADMIHPVSLMISRAVMTASLICTVRFPSGKFRKPIFSGWLMGGGRCDVADLGTIFRGANDGGNLPGRLARRTSPWHSLPGDEAGG